MKINRIKASVIATLSFFIENIYVLFIVLLAQWYTNLLSPDWVRPQINLSLRLLVLCLFHLDLLVTHYCLFIFSMNSFLSLAPSTNATPAFSTLLFFWTLSQMINFRLFQTERVYRWQFQILRKWQNTIQTARKHYVNRRNCLLRAISPFPTLFSKDLYCRHVITKAYLGKG